jgi:hypothetical protein
VKQRLVTFALALGALLLFYHFFLPKPPPELAKPSEPLSTDAGPDGELAMWRWLMAEGVPVTSLRQRYAQLNAASTNDVGNVLITVMPHRTLIHNDEWVPLIKWIQAGNTALVLAALDDTPRWADGHDAGFILELFRITQMNFSTIKHTSGTNGGDNGVEELRQTLSGFDVTLEPRGMHPLLSGVHTVHASSELPSARWRPDKGLRASFELVQRQDTQAAALWLCHIGKGQVIALSFASPFTNGEIDHADNARLLANIIGWARTSAGRVLFDDAHQGLSDFYDPRAFFADPRLHHTLWWIVLLWLAFVLGPLPLRDAFSPWRPVDETALIDAGGRFYSHAVGPQQAARRLFENFFNRLRRRLNLAQTGEPLWDWLGTQAVLTGEQRALLQSLYARMCAEERVDLARLQNLLTDLQGKLA